MWRSVLVVPVLMGAFQWWQELPVEHPPGQLVAADPVQQPTGRALYRRNGYSIEQLARFSVEARVLSVSHYRTDREAELAPVDLALGWGPMSDSAVLQKVAISQGNRFYYWRVEQFPIPRRAIETHSANMHMIPANAQAEDALRFVRVGQVVHVEGYLVEARAQDGWHWRSSLTREDTGAGACEVIWVEKLTVM